MSDSYYPHCLDCEDTCDEFARRRPESWAPVFACREALVAIAHAQATQKVSITVHIDHEGDPIPYWWFARHAGHRLRVCRYNGNAIVGTCMKRVDCDCGAGTYCRREPDHEGACDPKAVIA